MNKSKILFKSLKQKMFLLNAVFWPTANIQTVAGCIKARRRCCAAAAPFVFMSYSRKLIRDL
jgi:hypothetical protein